MLECGCFPEWMKKRWGWIVCAASFTIHVGIYSLAYCFSLLFVDMQRELNATAVETGLVGSVIWGIQMFSSPVGSFLEFILNYRAVIILVITFSSASIFVSSFAVSVKQLYVTLGGCYGLSLGTAWYVILSVMLCYFPTKNSVRAVSFAAMGSAAAMLCISEPVSMSVEAFGWRKTLQFISIFIIVVALPPAFLIFPPKVNEGVAVARPLNEDEKLQKGDLEKMMEAGKEKNEKQLEDVTEDKISDDGSQNVSGKETDSVGGARRDLEKVCGTSSRWKRWKRVVSIDTSLYAFFALTCAMSWSVFFVNIVSFYDSVGIDPNRSANLLTIVAVFELMSKALLATVGEKVPFRKTYLLLGKTVMLVFLSLAMAFVSSYSQFVVLSILIGTLRGCFNVLLWPCSLESLDRSCRDEVIIIVSVSRGIGFLTGTIPAGAIYDCFGSYRMSFLLVAGITSISSLCLASIPLRRRMKKRRKVRNIEQDAIGTLTGITPINRENYFRETAV